MPCTVEYAQRRMKCSSVVQRCRRPQRASVMPSASLSGRHGRRRQREMSRRSRLRVCQVVFCVRSGERCARMQVPAVFVARVCL